MFPYDTYNGNWSFTDQIGFDVSVPPEAEPVTVQQLQQQEQIDATDNQTSLLPIFISSARERAEDYCQRTFVQQSYVMTLDRFPHNKQWIYLLRPPIISIDAITYIDGTGEVQTLDPDFYYCDFGSIAPRLAPTIGNVWPHALRQPASVAIAYTAGYGFDGGTDGISTPPLRSSVVHAILLMAADGYRNRSSQMDNALSENATARDLLYPLRVL